MGKNARCEARMRPLTIARENREDSKNLQSITNSRVPSRTASKWQAPGERASCGSNHPGVGSSSIRTWIWQWQWRGNVTMARPATPARVYQPGWALYIEILFPKRLTLTLKVCDVAYSVLHNSLPLLFLLYRLLPPSC